MSAECKIYNSETSTYPPTLIMSSIVIYWLLSTSFCDVFGLILEDKLLFSLCHCNISDYFLFVYHGIIYSSIKNRIYFWRRIYKKEPYLIQDNVLFCRSMMSAWYHYTLILYIYLLKCQILVYYHSTYT